MDYKEALEKVVKPGLALLPAKFDTPEARVMLLAIGKQESRFEHRKQIGGPAHGFYQFEKGGGVKGVLTHPASKPIIERVLIGLNIARMPAVCYDCLAEPEHDALATVFARLLLYTDPHPLPALNCDPSLAWDYYFRNWRPGKPKRDTFDAYLMHAREAVNG
jgi:hypothetical protein